MDIGSLRLKVKIQALAGTQDTYGQENQTWTDVAERWASLEPLTGREFFAGQQIQGQANFRIRVRYLAGVLPKMRVLYGTRVFDIQAVINIEERNRELELLCLERV